MKRMLSLVLAALLLVACLSVGSAEEYNPMDFVTWVANEGSTGVLSSSFLPGDENRPTKEDLTTMLSLANTYFQCHGLTGAHFVVIQNEEEQESILKTMSTYAGLDCSGTVTVLVMADGVKDQEHHAATYYPGVTENPQYWNMYFGIYEAGWASGYLNMIATSMGYRMRAYAALDLVNADTGVVDLYGTGGNFAYINSENWDIAKYMTSADGSESFDHYVLALNDTIPLEGNVTLLCAIVIGTIDETDAVSGATHYSEARMENFDFWDWDDSYTSAQNDTDTDVVSSATAAGAETEEAGN